MSKERVLTRTLSLFFAKFTYSFMERIPQLILKRRFIMLKRFKDHCKNPVTWGAYYKLCGISFVASIIIGAVTFIKIWYDENPLDKIKILGGFGWYKHNEKGS